MQAGGGCNVALAGHSRSSGALAGIKWLRGAVRV